MVLTQFSIFDQNNFNNLYDDTGDDVILAGNDVILRFTCKLRYSDARYILTNGTLLVQQ